MRCRRMTTGLLPLLHLLLLLRVSFLHLLRLLLVHPLHLLISGLRGLLLLFA